MVIGLIAVSYMFRLQIYAYFNILVKKVRKKNKIKPKPQKERVCGS